MFVQFNDNLININPFYFFLLQKHPKTIEAFEYINYKNTAVRSFIIWISLLETEISVTLHTT